MNKLLRLLVALPGILFVVMGLRWITDPAGAAAFGGMPLLEGVARSSQIGDLGALFLSMGMMIFLAVITLKRSWFYAPVMVLLTVAVFRLVAWLFHGAALAPDAIAVEVIVASLLLFASSRLPQGQ
jgi:hypothetical protein